MNQPIKCNYCNNDTFETKETDETTIIKIGNKEKVYPKTKIICTSCKNEYDVIIPITYENGKLYHLSKSEMRTAEILLGSNDNRWKKGWSDLK